MKTLFTLPHPTHKHTTSSQTRCYSLKASVKFKKKKKNTTLQHRSNTEVRKEKYREAKQTKITAINLRGFLKKRKRLQKKKKKKKKANNKKVSKKMQQI